MSPLTAAEIERDDGTRRRRKLLVLGLFAALLLVVCLFEVSVRSSDLPVASNLLVLALLNLNVIVFLLLLVLLFRNLVKLGFDRRQARFKTKLVLAFLSLALLPGILIFIIASNFITRSIEGWFKPQVERPLDQALEVAQQYYQSLETTALRHGRFLVRGIERDELLAPGSRNALVAFVLEQRERLGLTALTVFDAAGGEVAHVRDPAVAVDSQAVHRDKVAHGLGGQEVTTVHELANGDMIQAVVPIRGPGRQVIGVLIVSTHVSQRLENKLRAISQAFQEYKQVRLLKNPIKGIYILVLLLMTLIIVFSATWFGLYLARGITLPIEKLAEGTREVAAGNLAYRVEVHADDEIGILVDSFNKMTGDLGSSQAKLEQAVQELQAKHDELEQRRRYTETVLQAVATGVVSLDGDGRVTTMNGAAARMLGVSAEAAQGRPEGEVFRRAEFTELRALLQRLARHPEAPVEREVHLRRDGQAMTLLASATTLQGPDGTHLGVVLVFDDLTELLRAQRLAAWREVAQRIAHEIKNPLTPIQLSAQRLRRRLGGDRSADEKRLLEEATGTIIQEVDGLKQLVDEFSRFARMPELSLRLTDLPRLLEGVVVLYRESHPELRITAAFAEEMPQIEVDPSQIKRAVLNLVDNAVEAVGPGGEVVVTTAWLSEAGRARIVVSDTGPGISAEDKERLFVAYFSTKATGMGLGLPIVQQIVSDHGGSIVVEDNEPGGSRFVIELPAGRVSPAATAAAAAASAPAVASPGGG